MDEQQKEKKSNNNQPDFWRRLTKKIDEAGITTEYEFLNSLAAKDQVCVGIKRGLMGDLTGTYIWMLFPLLNPGTNRLSNTIAIEAFNTQDNTEENKEQPTENTDSETEEETNQNPDRRTKTRHNRSNLLLQSNRKKRILTNQRRGSDQRTGEFHQKHQPIHD